MKVKVIVHNHWDREWFTTEDITSSWLKEVFFKVKKLTEKNPDFVYVMDGQTAMIEDLLTENPELEEEFKNLVKAGKILIGPYYIQIDWRIPKETSILKNLDIGIKDAKQMGKCMKSGWLLDNFGHISQEPQIHKLFGVNKVFLWRGVSFKNDMISQEFLWKGSDGTTIPTIFLVGGYRNLYNLKETKNITEKRLKHEIEKLQRFSKSGEILLLDGYDIDLSPEDPKEFLNIELTTPEDFPEQFPKDVPTLHGELLSGRYACTFPGTLSTRIYQKLESDIIEKLLKINDLFAILNNEETQEILWRDFLKTLAHDNICGVCVDPVHIKMDRIYKKMYFYLKKSIEKRLEKLAGKVILEKGKYVFSLSPFEYNHWYSDGEKTFYLNTKGIGFFKIDSFDDSTNKGNGISWKNEYYEAYFEKDGTLILNDKKIGVLELLKEKGDAYTTFVEETDFSVSLKKIEIVSRMKHSMIVEMERIVESISCKIKTNEKVIFDGTPIVKWHVILNTKGKGYKLSMVYKAGNGKIFAKMPFDVVERKEKDDYLLPESVPEELKGILLAARETGIVKEFPFQGFVALYDEKVSKTFLADGLREYWVDNGNICVTLVRSVEWITRNVKNRIGDAGPLMYVPGAKCEGVFKVKLAFMEIPFHPRSKEFFKWYSLFENPPLLLNVEADGNIKEHTFFSSSLPWVGVKDKEHLWVYNPYLNETEGLRPLEIGNKMVKTSLDNKKISSKVSILNFPEFPVFSIEINPENEILNSLKETMLKLDKDISKLKGETDPRLKHKYFSSFRTKKEIELSLMYLQNIQDVLRITRELNELRMKRRTYDYVVELLESEKESEK
ncbi:MAG TPA: alpha-mannosidase [Thermotoga sp.]|nr:alpha-mannosidase [Thermotoga sp.]